MLSTNGILLAFVIQISSAGLYRSISVELSCCSEHFLLCRMQSSLYPSPILLPVWPYHVPCHLNVLEPDMMQWTPEHTHQHLTPWQPASAMPPPVQRLDLPPSLSLPPHKASLACPGPDVYTAHLQRGQTYLWANDDISELTASNLLKKYAEKYSGSTDAAVAAAAAAAAAATAAATGGYHESTGGVQGLANNGPKSDSDPSWATAIYTLNAVPDLIRSGSSTPLPPAEAAVGGSPSLGAAIQDSGYAPSSRLSPAPPTPTAPPSAAPTATNAPPQPQPPTTGTQPLTTPARDYPSAYSSNGATVGAGTGSSGGGSSSYIPAVSFCGQPHPGTCGYAPVPSAVYGYPTSHYLAPQGTVGYVGHQPASSAFMAPPGIFPHPAAAAGSASYGTFPGPPSFGGEAAGVPALSRKAFYGGRDGELEYDSRYGV
uniref:Uncharacterized protein n=1 Tax=Eptatretus burgeri TaxID=7764 RepID=A0A8C4RCT6_EPTBU